MTWREQAACWNTHDPRPFIGLTEHDRRKSGAAFHHKLRAQFAEDYCHHCPVIEDCQRFVTELNAEAPPGTKRRPVVYGVWYGVDLTRSAKETLAKWKERTGQP